jgi:hypothetical protein
MALEMKRNQINAMHVMGLGMFTSAMENQRSVECEQNDIKNQRSEGNHIFSFLATEKAKACIILRLKRPLKYLPIALL